MNLFSQWIDGRPWWVTLLLLPVEIVAGVTERVVHYAAAALAVIVAVAALAALWRLRR